jgi:hypothetical protein
VFDIGSDVPTRVPGSFRRLIAGSHRTASGHALCLRAPPRPPPCALLLQPGHHSKPSAVLLDCRIALFATAFPVLSLFSGPQEIGPMRSRVQFFNEVHSPAAKRSAWPSCAQGTHDAVSSQRARPCSLARAVRRLSTSTKARLGLCRVCQRNGLHRLEYPKLEVYALPSHEPTTSGSAKVATFPTEQGPIRCLRPVARRTDTSR